MALKNLKAHYKRLEAHAATPLGRLDTDTPWFFIVFPLKSHPDA
jgi:hypothetical protein